MRTAHEEHLLATVDDRGRTSLRRRQRHCLRQLRQNARRQCVVRRLGVAATLRDAWRRLCTGYCDARDRRDGLLRAEAHARVRQLQSTAAGHALRSWRQAAAWGARQRSAMALYRRRASGHALQFWAAAAAAAVARAHARRTRAAAAVGRAWCRWLRASAQRRAAATLRAQASAAALAAALALVSAETLAAAMAAPGAGTLSASSSSSLPLTLASYRPLAPLIAPYTPY